MEKIFYQMDTEKDQIISQKQGQGKILIVDAITLEGNYLIFDDQPIPMGNDSLKPIKDKINEIALKVGVNTL